MYKAFIANQQKDATEPPLPEVDPEIKFKVDQIWKEIESQCQTRKDATHETDQKHDKENSVKSTDWKIVRLFVSSTFVDFFNEREVLVKKVFPELREWCLERKLKLIECDLRWGVPRDTPSPQTVSICMEEIDKCIEASDGCPLFIGLLGNRYGWVPTDTDISLEVRDKYRWVEGSSITGMEVIHGAYRTKNPNAAFYLRDPSAYSDIPQSHISYFVEENPLASYHLKVLKEKLSASLPDQVFQFEPRFKQMSEAASGQHHIVELEGFEVFAKDVLNFFKAAILRIHPEQDPREIDALCQEKETQWSYVFDKGSNSIGRQAEKAAIINILVEGDDKHFEKTDDAKSQMRGLNEWDVSAEDKPLCVVSAPSGWGKTTLVCSVIQDIVTSQTDWEVFYHLVGSTPDSVQVEKLLQRLLHTLIPEPTDEDRAVIESGRWENKKKLLRKALAEFGHQNSRKLIVIIDNLNGLSNSDSLNHLSWLPPFFPPNIRCLVSSSEHLPTTARLYEHPTRKMCLSTMTQEQLCEITMHYLATFSKKLHSSQLTSLLTSTGVDNPLWLTLMVEELRIFGSFGEMDQRIAEMPSSLNKFLVQVFDRLVKEDQSACLVKKVLCLTACCRYGLPADQVLQICGDANTKEPVSLLDWLGVKRSLKPYLRMSGFLEESIAFSHDAVHMAVLDHFLSKDSDICHWHTHLADFYQSWCDDGRAKAWNLLYHLRKAKLYQRIVQFMRTDKHSHFHLAPYQRSDYLKDCRCRLLADPVIPGNSPIMLCHMCSSKSYSLNPAVSWPNKNCCVICGNLAMGSNAAKAYACMKHAQRRGPDMVKCVLCNSVVKLKGNNPGGLVPNPAVLCQFCSFGLGERACAVLSCDKR